MFISGATGITAADINGPFDPTQEKGLDGRVLYAKRGDKSICMEHFGGKWQVKHVSHKGKETCVAHVAGGCGAEACTSRQWMVTFDNKTFAEAPLVKILAEAEVCSCRMPSCAILTAHLPPLLSLIQTPEGKAKAAAEAVEKAKYSQTLEILQRLGLQAHIPAFM